MSRDDGPSLARRAWLRAALWGAGGLSLLPGCSRGGPVITCYKPAVPTGQTSGQPSSAVGRWRELGRLWRELSAHARGKYGLGEGVEKLKALEAEITNALAALPASRELQTLFEERVAHVRRSRHVMATCYEMAVWSPAEPRSKVEEQMSALRKLQEDGKLTREAAEKAARVVAVQAEYMTRLSDADARGPEAGRDERTALWETYRAGGLVPGEDAATAGRRVVELEVDNPGLLADKGTGEKPPEPRVPGNTEEGAP